MTRALLTTFGSLGDLHPYIAVGKALQQQGVTARIATSGDYRSIVEAEGLEFAPVRPTLAELGSREEISRRSFKPLRGAEYLLRDLVLPHQAHAFVDISAAARGADLLISHPITYATQMVAEKLGKPWLASVLAPLSLMSQHDPPMLPGPVWFGRSALSNRWGYRAAQALTRTMLYRWEAPLRKLRADLQLPPTRKVLTMEGQYSGRGTLALFDAPLMAAQPDWPQPIELCGAALYDGRPADPRELARLRSYLDAAPAPIVFALGSSVVWIAKDFWEQAIAATVALGQRAILLTGKPPRQGLPPSVAEFEYLPYSAVFPHAAVIVHQAGAGTLAQALRAGRPQLITPAGFDQPDNAMRAARLGVARVLPFQQVNANRLTVTLRALLQDNHAMQAAQRLAQELQSTDGARSAATAIVDVLRSLPAQ
jgi:rhamnosyltransferase subunit B